MDNSEIQTTLRTRHSKIKRNTEN